MKDGFSTFCEEFCHLYTKENLIELCRYYKNMCLKKDSKMIDLKNKIFKLEEKIEILEDALSTYQELYDS